VSLICVGAQSFFSHIMTNMQESDTRARYPRGGGCVAAVDVRSKVQVTGGGDGTEKEVWEFLLWLFAIGADLCTLFTDWRRKGRNC
jgi:hypothetical protein